MWLQKPTGNVKEDSLYPGSHMTAQTKGVYYKKREREREIRRRMEIGDQ